jgi:hypothetical protein
MLIAVVLLARSGAVGGYVRVPTTLEVLKYFTLIRQGAIPVIVLFNDMFTEALTLPAFCILRIGLVAS